MTAEIDDIPNEILEGIIEINTNEESRDIIETLYYSMHEEIKFADLLERINIKKRAQNKKLKYMNFFKSLDMLEQKGLIKSKYSSPPSYSLNKLGTKTVKFDRHIKKNILKPLAKQLEDMNLSIKEDLRDDIRDSYVQSIEKKLVC